MFAMFVMVVGVACQAQASIIQLEVPAATAGLPSGEDPTFHYFYHDIAGNLANLTIAGLPLESNSFLIMSGTLDVIGGLDTGVYALEPSGPNVTLSPAGAFLTNNTLYS